MACEQKPVTPQSTAGIDECVDALWASVRDQFHRRMVWLSGDVADVSALAGRLLKQQPGINIHWHGDGAPADIQVSQGREAFQQLGRECDALVFNAWSGFDPDAFGALSGTLRGGGLLFLLTPSAADWSTWSDPEYTRIAVAQFSVSEISGRYLRRLTRLLQQDAGSLWIESGEVKRRPVIHEMPAQQQTVDLSPCRTQDQQYAVEAVIHVVSGHRRRPVVLQSDRGRGKSAAFGIAAARLISERQLRVVVTAPRRQAVEAVMERASALLTPEQCQLLRYMPPDVLVRSDCDADLLLVDEAAAISAPLLEQLLKRYPRMAFSTTVHGYEGTGRGFAVRFNNVLDRCTNSWKTVMLNTPVRWGEGDPLEPLVFRLLMLDANAAPDAVLESACLDDVQISCVERDQLIEDETLLRELFGLLVLAHYKTRPFDLRQLLDGPNLSVWLMRIQGHIAAAALVAEEGGFSTEDAQDISADVRRPHGHLLPETLAVHLGLVDAPALRAQRVMRIAVHPAVQGRGLGSRLIACIRDTAAAEGIDYLGSSFGANDDLLRFWQNADWTPVRISERRGASSGSHSVIVLKPLSRTGGDLCARARQRFLRHFPHQLSDSLRDLEARMVIALMRNAPDSMQTLDDDDLEDVRRFAFERRFPESAIGALWGWLCNRLMSENTLDTLVDTDAGLLIARFLQKRDWSTCARDAGLGGHDQALARLRELVRQLL
ncbi:tRNA(Met)-cytidine N(4)-acetyltransferase [Thiogranum longum]|uniref:tRNA(Met) cytidine acetyltransferase TmcA n=1 Tax=Thiogranum longum TaxID=1537524 RepID=A0A4R1HF23_9GAMM|nr:GNAT family N-acetyltransferase [Thiogranum longum]TCK17959.1 tRNA(Met)-cytidine N(4)-acetyltransferase [Thiogranum longum]